MGLFNSALALVKATHGASAGDVFSTALGFDDTPAKHMVNSAIDNSIVGDYFNNKFDTVKSEANLARSALEEERAYNERIAEEKYQKDLETANTAYQRTAEDLSKVGINPYAMLSGLSPVSQPTYGAAYSTGYAVANLQAQSNQSIARMNRNARLVGGMFNSALSVVNSSVNALSRIGMALAYKKK